MTPNAPREGQREAWEARKRTKCALGGPTARGKCRKIRGSARVNLDFLRFGCIFEAIFLARPCILEVASAETPYFAGPRAPKVCLRGPEGLQEGPKRRQKQPSGAPEGPEGLQEGSPHVAKTGP